MPLSCVVDFALAQNCNCDFVIPSGKDYYVFDGEAKGIEPGQTICLESGYREVVLFKNINGTPENGIIIKNCNGLVEIGSDRSNNGITISNCKYMRITGSGSTKIDYGIKVLQSRNGTQGIAATNYSSDLEIDHIEITQTGFSGIMIKDDPDCKDPNKERPGFIIKNIHIHDNYIHNVPGEGIYLGNSYYTGIDNACERTLYPQEVKGVRIYNNLFSNTGWESIQIGSAVEDVEVHNNKISNYGMANVNMQNGGIQFGLGTTGRLYNNFIKHGMGIAIVIQGIGENYVYNNIIIDPGESAINVNVRPTPLNSDIVSKGFLGGIYVMNNTFINADEVITEYINEAKANIFCNNLIINSSRQWNKLKSYTDWDVSHNLVLDAIEDAKFKEFWKGDYRLSDNSPAISIGKNLTGYGVNFDFYNTNRSIQGKWIIGASGL